MRLGLTPRPNVPAWLELAAAAVVFTGLACGDDSDDGSASNSTDVAPTAGPCAHDPMSPDCETGSSSATTMTTDVAPTIPCAHDSDPSDCDTTGASTSTGTGDMADSSTSDADGSDSDSSETGTDSGSTGG